MGKGKGKRHQKVLRDNLRDHEAGDSEAGEERRREANQS